MPYQEVTTENFGGVDLTADPPEVGYTRAIDLLDVELDRRGRVRQRDGYDNFTSSAHSIRFGYLAPFYRTNSAANQLVACVRGGTTTGAVVVYNTAGGVAASFNAAVITDYGRPVAFGTPIKEVVYLPWLGVSSAGGAVAQSWDGSSFAATAGVSNQYDLLAVQARDNRLVGGRARTVIGRSEVGFSIPGDEATVDGTVSITPGDGQQINALVAWGDLVFAFKETKFAVFYGNSTDTTGGAVFNYRMVNSGDGVVAAGDSIGAACAGRPGVFFLNRRGIYLTQGGEPRLMSLALDPLFLGSIPATYSGLAINQASIDAADMCWMNERLYVTVPTGTATANDRLLVWDSIRDEWTIWSIPAGGVCAFRQGSSEELHFSYATGSAHIGRQSSSFTTDDGTNIASFYRPGFSDMGSSNVKRVRQTQMFGTGSVAYSMAVDYGAVDTPATVTLGTAPVVDDGWDRVARRGRMLSWKVASVSGGAWTLHRVTNYIADQRLPGVG